MRIGILFCGYNCLETLEKSIAPWVVARDEKLDGHEFVISAVSVPFKEYQTIDLPVDKTPESLGELIEFNSIDYLVTAPKFISEAEARTLALEPLLLENLDYVMLWDGDEIITLDQINAILNYVRLDPWCSWFSISYKNYVFNNKTYLLEAFTPPRVFKVKSNGYALDSFSWDNDVIYRSVNDPKVYIEYRQLPTKIIPKHVAWVKHLTWLSTPKTKAKVAYQKDHFKGVCSYRWNDVTNAVEFDPDFYARRRISIPETAQEND